MNETAATIRSQIGNGALYMLGAKNQVYGENWFSFRIRGCKAINYVKITLNGKDLYDMEFGKVWGANYKIVETHEDVYFDNLKSIIENATGLYTSL